MYGRIIPVAILQHWTFSKQFPPCTPTRWVETHYNAKLLSTHSSGCLLQAVLEAVLLSIFKKPVHDPFNWIGLERKII